MAISIQMLMEKAHLSSSINGGVYGEKLNQSTWLSLLNTDQVRVSYLELHIFIARMRIKLVAGWLVSEKRKLNSAIIHINRKGFIWKPTVLIKERRKGDCPTKTWCTGEVYVQLCCLRHQWDIRVKGSGPTRFHSPNLKLLGFWNFRFRALIFGDL